MYHAGQMAITTSSIHPNHAKWLSIGLLSLLPLRPKLNRVYKITALGVTFNRLTRFPVVLLLGSWLHSPTLAHSRHSQVAWNALSSTLRDIADRTRFSKHTSLVHYLSFLPYAFSVLHAWTYMYYYVRQAIELRVLLLILLVIVLS